MKQLQKVMAEAKQLEDVIPWLSAPFRKRLIRLLADQADGHQTRAAEAELARYQQFFRTITSYDSSGGAPNTETAYAYVWTKNKSKVLYQLEFVGEGRGWRLSGWEAQLIGN